MALTIFLESKNFEHSLQLAVSVGGDTDTIAAITGSIAEACYGIPEHIKIAAMAYLPKDIIDVLSNFYKHINERC